MKPEGRRHRKYMRAFAEYLCVVAALNESDGNLEEPLIQGVVVPALLSTQITLAMLLVRISLR